jgi:murein DD-endopeptidase MepM/ murein hydrolase activator NlpD
MNGQKENRWFRFRQWMREKYQLTVRNKAFEEKLSFDISRGHVFVAAALSIILLIILTTLLIALTPLREYIPGYGSTGQSKKLFTLRLQLDSLANRMDAYDHYIQNIREVLGEDFSADSNVFSQTNHQESKPADNAFAYSKEDSLLLAVRWQQQPESPPSVRKHRRQERHLLFQPVSGTVVPATDANIPGVIVSVAPNIPLHAVENGMVVYADDRTICIQHPDNRISSYHHFQRALVHKGTPVRCGQVIAFTRTDTSITAFEYWVEGRAVDPLTYFSFK